MKTDLYKTNASYYNSISFYKSSSTINKMYETCIDLILPKIRTSVINSVKRRLHADRPVAFLLSGGVDSSLVAAISARILGKNIRTFCCGIKGSTDMVYAKKSGHIGGSFSLAELVALLYSDYDIGGKDKLILSKGHAVPILYAALHELGKITDEQLALFREIDSPLTVKIVFEVFP